LFLRETFRISSLVPKTTSKVGPTTQKVKFALGRVFENVYTDGFTGLTVRSQGIAFAAGALIASVNGAADVRAKTLVSLALVDVETGAPVYAKIKTTSALTNGAFGGFSAFLGAWIVDLSASSLCNKKVQFKILHVNI
jgi:hypothetical protein